MPAIWVALAGCAATPSAGDTREPSQPGSSDVSDEATDDTDVEQDRLGFDHCLQVRHSNTDVPHELHDGDTVATGDRVRVTVTTSEDAYLYLAFCSHHKLTIYPSQRGVPTRAGSLACIPGCSRELIFDKAPGPEVLYLIVSQVKLSMADPKPARTIGNAGHDHVECDTALDAKLAVSPPVRASRKPADGKPADGKSADDRPARKPARRLAASQAKKNVRRDEAVPPRVPKKPRRPLKNILRGVAVAKKPKPQPRLPEVKGSFTSTSKQGAGSAAPPPPDPDFLRSPGQNVWYDNGLGDSSEVVAADYEGIAVVRYGFTHVASISPP
jgi:hypothetical protein